MSKVVGLNGGNNTGPLCSIHTAPDAVREDHVNLKFECGASKYSA